MLWDGLLLLGLLAGVLGVRWLALWVARLGWGLGIRLYEQVGQAAKDERIRSVVSAARSRFPRLMYWTEARLTPRRFAGLPLTLIVISAVYLLGLFAGLIEELVEADELVRLDTAVNAMLAPLRTDTTVAALAWFTGLGGSVALTAVVVVTTALVWGLRHAYMIPGLWATLIGSQITIYVTKRVLDRERPEFLFDIAATSPSFPSGHAAGAMAVYGFVAYIVARHLVTARQRFELVYWTAVLVAMIGFSRMLLTLHYLSDVVAGFVVGAFWLLVGFVMAEQLRLRQHTGHGRAH